MLVTTLDHSLGQLLSSGTAMAAAWGDAARHVQMVLTLLMGAPLLADALGSASVRFVMQPRQLAAAVRGPVTVTLTCLNATGAALPFRLPAPPDLAAVSVVQVEHVQVQSAQRNHAAAARR